MKRGIAFVAHCPEVRENQRVVVAGECPELGGWELGDALCMRPAPCGRPWWVSSEVEVNLSESPLGVSAEFAAVAETEGRVGKVGVSELKFRLLAVPNDGEGSGVPNSDNVVSLEPLRGGDFRVVRLVGASSPSDSSAVGERGDNTIHVGVEGGGEQQERELVGISVEWGVLESVQLALLPRLTNRQTEHPQRDTDPQSEIACPPRTEGIPVNARISESPDEQRSASGSSVCPSQSAVELCLKENEVHPDRSPSVGVCNRPSADTNVTDNRFLSCHPPTSPHLLPHDCTRGRRQEEDGQRAQLVPRDQKRRRSESGLTQVEADECDQVGGCAGERREDASWGVDGDVFREEKQRRLTVALSNSAPLFSELCSRRGDPDAGEKGVVCENGHRGGEVKRNRHGKILCLHARVLSRCKDCGGGSVCEHGRQRSQCKECGGKSICEHGRIRSQCKECGGKGICEHGRERRKCKDCGGGSVCEHGRQRSQCKECGGKGICEHGRRRNQCKECGGKSICEHGRERIKCKECGGTSICEHGRQRYQCKECGGKSICEHGRRRNQCKECGGKSICEHGRQRSKCKECGGKQFCEHGRRRYYCKECGEKGICIHRKDRRFCNECKKIPSTDSAP